MSTDVVVQMSAQDAELVAAWQRARQGPAAMEGELNKLARTGRRAGKEMQDGMEGARGGFASAVLAVGSYAAGIATATTVQQLFRLELETTLQRMQEIAKSNIGMGKAMLPAIRALPENADITKSEMLRLVREQVNIPAADTFPAVTSALREGGEGFSSRRSVETAIAATKLAPLESAETIADLASGAVSLQKADPKLTPQQAVAQLSAMYPKSESPLGEIAKEFGPSIGRIQAFAPGTSIAEGGALALAIEGTQDAGFTKAASVAEKILLGMSEAGLTGTITEQLEQARRDPKIKQRVTLRAGRDPGARLAAEQLLNGGAVAENFARFSQDIGSTPAETLARETRRIEELTGTPELQSPLVDQGVKGSVEKIALAEMVEGFKSQATEALDKAQTLTGTSGTYRRLTRATRGFASLTQDDETYLRSTAGMIRQTRDELGSKANAETVAAINELIGKVDEMIQTTRDLKDQPQNVVIKGDDRPNVRPGKAPVEGIND